MPPLTSACMPRRVSRTLLQNCRRALLPGSVRISWRLHSGQQTLSGGCLGGAVWIGWLLIKSEHLVVDRESASSVDKTHLFGLDLLRLLAAVLVVFDHFGAFSSARPDLGTPFAFPRLNFMSTFGWVGVEIFFVISGFVIALSARDSSPGDFLRRRALRIFPALWVCSCIAAVALATTSHSYGELSLWFIHSIVLSPRGPYVDGVVWSLIVEAVFYLLIWLALSTSSFKRLDPVAEFLGVASAIFLTVYGLAEVFKDVTAAAHIVALFERFPFKVVLLRYGVFFALGMVLWLGFEYGFTARRKWFGCLLSLFCVAEIAIQAESDATQSVVASSMSPILAGAVPIVVWSLAMLVLIASVAYRYNIGDMLEGRRAWITSLGLLTFPLYLNHYTIGRVVAYDLLSAHMAPSVVLLILLAIVFGSSWLIMRIAEPAVRNALSKLWKPGRPTSMTHGRAASADINIPYLKNSAANR